MHQSVQYLIAATFSVMLLGCTTSIHKPAAPGATVADIGMPPKQLLAQAMTIINAPPISLPIESEHEGKVITGWQSFQGDWHIARHWQERTRYVIQVSPDWNAPTERSHIEISAQTQQRAASNQIFADAPELDRSDRAAELLRQIEEELNHRKIGSSDH